MTFLVPNCLFADQRFYIIDHNSTGTIKKTNASTHSAQTVYKNKVIQLVLLSKKYGLNCQQFHNFYF